MRTACLNDTWCNGSYDALSTTTPFMSAHSSSCLGQACSASATLVSPFGLDLLIFVRVDDGAGDRHTGPRAVTEPSSRGDPGDRCPDPPPGGGAGGADLRGGGRVAGREHGV